MTEEVNNFIYNLIIAQNISVLFMSILAPLSLIVNMLHFPLLCVLNIFKKFSVCENLFKEKILTILSRFLVEKAEQTKKATVISAEGDAQAAILLAKAFGEAGEGLVELRRIEAAEDIAYQLSRSRQVSYLPGGQNLLLNVPTPGN